MSAIHGLVLQGLDGHELPLAPFKGRRRTMKNIYETLAALGAGAIMLTGCGGTTPTAASPDVPAATETTPRTEKAAEPTEQATGDAAAADASKGADNAAASPSMAGSAPAGTASPSGTAAPATSAPAKAAAKPAAKKTGSTTTASGKKKDAAGSCGEGTCS